MKRFSLYLLSLIIFSGSLSACRVLVPAPVISDDKPIQNIEKPIANNNIENRLNELTVANRQLKEKITQLERRQNDLERSIAVLADRNNMAMENTLDETPPNTLADAQQAYQHRQYAKAVALLNRHLQENISSADEPDALWLLANSHAKLNNCESAVRTAHQLTQRHTEYSRTPDAFLLIAQCQNRLQQKDSAKTTLRSLIVKYPNSRAAKKARQLLK